MKKLVLKKYTFPAFKNIDHLDSRPRLPGIVKFLLLWLFKSLRYSMITTNSDTYA